MSTALTAALLAAGALLALTAVLTAAVVWAVVRLRRDGEALRSLRVEAEAAAAQLQHAAATASAAAARLAEQARHREAGTRLAYEALSTPVVKGLALASGVSQAARSLRRA